MRNNRIRLLVGAASAILLLLPAGCKTGSKDERSEGRAIDDKQITQHIDKNLEQDPTYKFGDVNVQTFGGVVQLSGFVNVQAQKARAQQIAQYTDGVREVVNGISLKPLAEPLPATSRDSSGAQIYSEPPSSSSNPAPVKGGQNLESK